MSGVTEVRLFFDFQSPYSCLALLRAEAFERENDLRFLLRPFSLGIALDHFEIKGGGVVAPKRKYIAADTQRVAEQMGVPFPGPPEHPFMSFDALRVAVLFREEPEVLGLCAELARRCWCEGQDLTDRDILRAAIEARGLDATDLDERLLDRSLKKTLRAHANEAIETGVFGVPTFALGDELFWGQDRMEMLARRVRGELSSPLDAAREQLSRG